MAKAKQVSSWGDIPQKTFEAFFAKVEKLREEMIPRDCDGDSPIEVLIVNRMTHLPISYFPVPRNDVYSYITHGYLEVHPDRQQELIDKTERELSNNVQMAGEALDHHIRMKLFKNAQEREHKRPVVDRIKEACASCKRKIGFDPDHNNDSYKVTRAKYPDYPSKYHSDGLECGAFRLHRWVWELNHPETLRPRNAERWCMNPECRCKLPDKRNKNANVCVNPRCGLDNSKHYPETSPDE